MIDYVADTHSLLWYFVRPDRLGSHATEAFQQVAVGQAKLHIPVIALAEIVFVVEAGRIKVDLVTFFDQLTKIPNLNIVPLIETTVQQLPQLTAIPEMHDRLIVAEAIRLQASLITRDQAITTSGLVPVIW